MMDFSVIFFFILLNSLHVLHIKLIRSYARLFNNIANYTFIKEIKIFYKCHVSQKAFHKSKIRKITYAY